MEALLGAPPPGDPVRPTRFTAADGLRMGARTTIGFGLVGAAVAPLAPDLVGLAVAAALGLAIAAVGAMRWSARARRDPIGHRWLALAGAIAGALLFVATLLLGEGGLFTLVELVVGAVVAAMGVSSYWVTADGRARKSAPFAPRTGAG